MARTPRLYSPADVTRAVRAVERAGLSVARVRFTPEGFEVVAGQPEAQDTSSWFDGSPLYRDVA